MMLAMMMVMVSCATHTTATWLVYQAPKGISLCCSAELCPALAGAGEWCGRQDLQQKLLYLSTSHYTPLAS